MSVRQWWRGRLAEGTPFWHPSHRVVPHQMWPRYSEDNRPLPGWPAGVHSSTWYEDYLLWFEGEYVKAFNSPYYQEFPEQVPVPVHPHEFYTEIDAYAPKVGFFQRHVPTCTKRHDKWVNVLRVRGYRRLPDLGECRNVFNALHPEARVEAPAVAEPGAGARRVAPWDPGSML